MSGELLFSVTKKDFRIDTFRAGGKGGQKQNKTSSGVRITHIESGAVGESREERSQHENKKRAFRRCVESDKFKQWHKRKTAEMLANKSELERKVNASMRDDNLRVETFDINEGELAMDFCEVCGGSGILAVDHDKNAVCKGCGGSGERADKNEKADN